MTLTLISSEDLVGPLDLLCPKCESASILDSIWSDRIPEGGKRAGGARTMMKRVVSVMVLTRGRMGCGDREILKGASKTRG